MLRKGVIVDNAPPQELLKRIGGKVWLLPCDEAEVVDLQQKYRVTNIARDEAGGEVILRVLSEEKPAERAKAAIPELEVYYLHIFGEVVGRLRTFRQHQQALGILGREPPATEMPPAGEGVPVHDMRKTRGLCY